MPLTPHNQISPYPPFEDKVVSLPEAARSYCGGEPRHFAAVPQTPRAYDHQAQPSTCRRQALRPACVHRRSRCLKQMKLTVGAAKKNGRRAATPRRPLQISDGVNIPVRAFHRNDFAGAICDLNNRFHDGDHGQSSTSNEAATVARALADQAEHVSSGVMGRAGSRRSRREVRWGNRGSRSVCLAGEKRGLWIDFETGEGGDLLDLIARRAGRSSAVRQSRSQNATSWVTSLQRRSA